MSYTSILFLFEVSSDIFRNTWLAEYEGEIVIKGDHISDYAWKVYLLYIHIHVHVQYVHAYMYSMVCKACSNLIEYGGNSCR